MIWFNFHCRLLFILRADVGDAYARLHVVVLAFFHRLGMRNLDAFGAALLQLRALFVIDHAQVI